MSWSLDLASFEHDFETKLSKCISLAISIISTSNTRVELAGISPLPISETQLKGYCTPFLEYYFIRTLTQKCGFFSPITANSPNYHK